MDSYKTHGAFSWSELMTSDPQAALRFYQQLFGWTLEKMPMAQGDYHVVKTEGTSVGGIMKMPPRLRPAACGRPGGCYVTVNDVDECARQATALGGRLLHGPADIPASAASR
jgi:predicted enzyme related to lactoylglutathione lyase